MRAACGRSLLVRRTRRPAAVTLGQAAPATQAQAAVSTPDLVVGATRAQAAVSILGQAAGCIPGPVVACTQAQAAGSIPARAAVSILGLAAASILDHRARTDIVVHGALA